jgi:hypothetical protein
MKIFFDKLSESLYSEIPDTSSATNKVMLCIEKFEVGQSYVTAKVENRYGDIVKLNIEGGSQGIELQDTLFTPKSRQPRFAYIMTTLSDNGKILVRKLPVLGVKDWLLIYEDDLFLLAVKDAYDEMISGQSIKMSGRSTGFSHSAPRTRPFVPHRFGRCKYTESLCPFKRDATQ